MVPDVLRLKLSARLLAETEQPQYAPYASANSRSKGRIRSALQNQPTNDEFSLRARCPLRLNARDGAMLKSFI